MNGDVGYSDKTIYKLCKGKYKMRSDIVIWDELYAQGSLQCKDLS